MRLYSAPPSFAPDFAFLPNRPSRFSFQQHLFDNPFIWRISVFCFFFHLDSLLSFQNVFVSPSGLLFRCLTFDSCFDCFLLVLSSCSNICCPGLKGKPLKARPTPSFWFPHLCLSIYVHADPSVPAGSEKGRCVASEYFTEPEVEITTENTANILSKFHLFICWIDLISQ